VAIEKATTLGWERFVGTSGAIVGMETFGVSAPLKALLTKFGSTPEAVARVAKDQLAAS
jgi:transketolase